MEIVLYKYRGIPQVINKTLSGGTRVSGVFRQPFDFKSPTLKLSTGYDAFRNNGINYVLIDGKYYYVLDWSIEESGAISLELHIDVLMTYKDDIMDMDVILSRSETGDDDLVDGLIPLSSNKAYERREYEIGFSEQEEFGTYVLITAQTGYSPVGG